ncbi:Pyruvate decarboxylase [Fonsecaea pedrosoi]|nr:Pyruvate decarboxylase [Fonsecaea pedrosoi]
MVSHGGRTTVAKYLFTRLRQQGVHAIHGVPGDFTLRALDYLSPAGVKWVGTCNELSAGYAADGYARVRGLGALLTTYGVGELSAINAVAGSFSEHVPVVSIVGTPQRRLQDQRKNVHHTLGDGRPRVFAEMARHVTVAQANLVDEATAPEQIDRTILAALRESRPAYIELPADMASKEVVDGERLLEEPLSTKDVTAGDDTDELEKKNNRERKLVDHLLQKIYAAKQPLVLVDSGGGVRQLRGAINAFVHASGIPTLCMPSGNGMVEHALPNYYGVHSGPVGQIDTMPYVRDADLVIAFGPMFSDTQTLSWKVVPEADRTITLEKNSIHDPTGPRPITDAGAKKESINLERFLARLTRQIDRAAVASPDVTSLGDFRTIQPPAYAGAGVDLDAPIDQTSFYLRLSAYLRPHDTVVLGNATPILGGRDLVLPRGAQTIASGQWFSIGHMLPLTMGVSLARQHTCHQHGFHHQRDAQGNPTRTTQSPLPRGRTILLDGDGGFQVTAQELGTMIRYRIPATIFLVNNAGYAYERQIHGMHEDYNDLAPWRYGELARAFGASDEQEQLSNSNSKTVVRSRSSSDGPMDDRDGDDSVENDESDSYPVRTYEVSTWRHLDELLANKAFCRGRGLHFVDVRMGKFDVPEKFKVVFQRAGESLG